MTGRLLGEAMFSAANRRRFEHWAWVPDGDGPFPLLLLLHGVYDLGACWWTKGGAIETLDSLGLPIVVLMAGDTGAEQGSGYCDWADGTTYAETYLLDELLPWADANLPVHGTTRHVAGLSMGGYGSLLLALRRPGLFESASSTSGFFFPERLFEFVPDAAARMWGDDTGRTAHDVRALLASASSVPRMAFDCGTEDHLFQENRSFHAFCTEHGVKHGYAEHPGGHEWGYWAARLPDHVRFALDLPGPLQP